LRVTVSVAQTRVPADRVLEANWDWYAIQDLEFRPAVQVLLWGLLLAALAGAPRIVRRFRLGPAPANPADVRARRAAREATAVEARAGETA
jgi:hypothetical protein